MSKLIWDADVGGLEVLPGIEATSAEANGMEWTKVDPKPGCITGQTASHCKFLQLNETIEGFYGL